MINPRWRKIFRDLWNNKTRTLLVILSIAIGVAAIGMVVGTSVIISRELPKNYARVNPASANIYASLIDDDVVQVIRNMKVAEQVEGRFETRVRIETGPNKWRDLVLLVQPDFNNIQIDKILPESGAWPPEKGEILIERASLPLINASVGDTIVLETPNGQRESLKISGLAKDITRPAGTFTNTAQGFISFDTLELFGYPRNYNQLLLKIEGDTANREHTKQVANQIGDKIRKGGRIVYAVVLANSGRLWFVSFIQPMTSILGILGVLLVGLSGLLVINTISALLAQQTRQIGVMKAVGANTMQIAWMYLVSMLIIGSIALLIAVPSGNFITRKAVGLLAGIINFDIVDFRLPPQVLMLQAALSLGVPFFAALIPVLHGSRVSVREAISDYGLTRARFGMSFFDRMIGTIHGLPRPMLLSLRNTFRQKSRLLLTLIVLAIGSAIFVAVASVYGSLNQTLDQALKYYNFDIAVYFNRPYRIEQISNEINTIPGIQKAETWDALTSRIILPDGSKSDNILMIAPPAGTSLVNPTILSGRWLRPDDENSIVINTDVLRFAPGIKVGEEISIDVEDKETVWNVVGIVRSVLNGPTAYANYPYFSRTFGRYGLSGSIYVSMADKASGSQQVMERTLEDHFERVGLKVSTTNSVSELRSTAIRQYNVIFIFLIFMAVLLTVVGGFGLTGTMSLNVLERTREIGVMRAVGASNGAVMQIVIVEGLIIGFMSWLLGLLLAYPLASMMGVIVGNGFLREPLPLNYSWNGALIWLFVVVLLATIASYLPARNAVRLTVRDVLAYE
jgi:putative ABC transport system permease protein